MATSHTAPPPATVLHAIHLHRAAQRGRDVPRTAAQAGGAVARGFFNDFDADGARDAQAREDDAVPGGRRRDVHPDSVMAAAAVRRPGDRQVPAAAAARWRSSCGAGSATAPAIFSLEGAERPPRYTQRGAAGLRLSARRAPPLGPPGDALRPSCRSARPPTGGREPSLERHAYLLSARRRVTGCPSAVTPRRRRRASRRSIRRLFHNPDGYERRGRVRLHDLLRVRPGARRDLRPRAPGAAGHVAESRVAVRRRKGRSGGGDAC